MDYADHEKVIPKLISTLHQKIFPLTKVNKWERTDESKFEPDSKGFAQIY